MDDCASDVFAEDEGVGDEWECSVLDHGVGGVDGPGGDFDEELVWEEGGGAR